MKELEKKKNTKDSGYPPEPPVLQPSVSLSSEKAVIQQKLVIKPFRGEGTSWIIFAKSFRSAIDSSTKSSGKDELSFGYLEGPTLKTVSGLNLYNENYDEAWKLLKDVRKAVWG